MKGVSIKMYKHLVSHTRPQEHTEVIKLLFSGTDTNQTVRYLKKKGIEMTKASLETMSEFTETSSLFKFTQNYQENHFKL